MGVSGSALTGEETDVQWEVLHDNYDSEWTRFMQHRYGTGMAATGLASNVVLPRLLRRRLQDWLVLNFSFRIGEQSVSYGRELNSMSQSDWCIFHGIDIFFGPSTLTSWTWYCKNTEWYLRLHRVVVETLDLPRPRKEPVTGKRFPGAPHWIGAEPPESVRKALEAEAATVDTASSCAANAASNESRDDAQPRGEAETLPDSDGDAVTLQMTMWFSNASGHPGMLCLPVTRKGEALAAEAAERLNREFSTPLRWAGMVCDTDGDYQALGTTAINITDLLLLGIEPDTAMALTPDSTWELYPQGRGEVTRWEAQTGDVVSEVGDEGSHIAAPEDEGSCRSQAAIEES